MPMTFRAKDSVLNVRRATSFATYTPQYGIITTVPDQTILSGQAGATEVSYTGYARVTASFNAPATVSTITRQVTNSGIVTWGTMTAGTGGHCGYVGEFDAASAGNLLGFDKLPNVGSALTITAASNATPISVTATAHGLATGMFVSVSAVGGNTAANGDFKVTNTGANTFTLDGSVGNGTYTSGGAAQRFGFEVTLAAPTPSAPIGLLIHQQT